VLGRQVDVSLLLDGELRGRFPELRADAANQARRLGGIPARAQIPRAPLGSRLAALASSGRSGRSGGSGWRRRGTEARLQRPRPPGSQPANARPASKARLYQPRGDQSERSRARPTVASIAQRSRAQRSEAQHSDPKHSTAIRSTAIRSTAQRGNACKGRLWPIKHSGARGVKGHSTAQRKWPFYVKPTGRTSHSAQGFLTAQNPMHNRRGR
jgi:hypothetical protein